MLIADRAVRPGLGLQLTQCVIRVGDGAPVRGDGQQVIVQVIGEAGIERAITIAL